MKTRKKNKEKENLAGRRDTKESLRERERERERYG